MATQAWALTVMMNLSCRHSVNMWFFTHRIGLIAEKTESLSLFASSIEKRIMTCNKKLETRALNSTGLNGLAAAKKHDNSLLQFTPIGSIIEERTVKFMKTGG